VSVWITEAEVVRLMDMKGAIAALDRGLALEAAGKAENMVKTHAIWGGHHTLHAIGATFADEGFVGTKTWAHANGAAPLLILFDSHNGSLRAIIEAFALGQLRTGAISGLATKYLAAEGASDMALIGTGKQAMTQLAAVAAVRPLRRVRAFSRDGAARADFIARASKALGLNIEEASSVAQAVDNAAIVTLVTRATKPILASGMLAAGTHVNAVGAISPERTEFEPALLWSPTACRRCKTSRASSCNITGGTKRNGAPCVRYLPWSPKAAAGPRAPTSPCSRPWAWAFRISRSASKSCGGRASSVLAANSRTRNPSNCSPEGGLP